MQKRPKVTYLKRPALLKVRYICGQVERIRHPNAAIEQMEPRRVAIVSQQDLMNAQR